MTQNRIDKLNEFLRGELAAVETYDLASKNVTHVELASMLRQLRDDHDARVTMLREKVRALGAEPALSSGVWGTFAKALQAGADLFGESAAMAALEEGEDRGLAMYVEASAKAEPVVVDIVDARLLPAQRKTHDICRSLKRVVKAA